MYPGEYAQTQPDKIAILMAESGEALTYKELDDNSNQLAQLWWDQGLRCGDHVALFMENRAAFFEVYWAAMRSGLYLTAINRYLTAEEAAYIVEDCGAQAIVSSDALAPVAEELIESTPRCVGRLMLGEPASGWTSYRDALAAFPAQRLDDEPRGRTMLYSSGTTGRPKGVKRPLDGDLVSDEDPVATRRAMLFGIDQDAIYLSPAPLYHAAPLGFTARTQMSGGTVVALAKFDAEGALAAIEEHGVSVSQWVPTMFSRMLKLPEEARTRHDLSSHRVAIHAAAPCPVEVKRQMIEWWGPILLEYYAGTEGNGTCLISSVQWLDHPGSVGQPINADVHICDEEGNEVAVGQEGTIYFEQPPEEALFEYHNDPDKTRDSRHPDKQRWTTLGDVGYVDEDGFVYLTDRKAFMIISGGVNIYPQEIENALVLHPKVLDVAVIGVPNEDLGEEVKALIQPADWDERGDDLAAELLAYCREHLAGYKVPKSVDFERQLPRLPTGKLYKRKLRERYWPKS